DGLLCRGPRPPGPRTVSRPVVGRTTHDRNREADRPDTGPETGRETALGPGGRGPRHSSPTCRGHRQGGNAGPGPDAPASDPRPPWPRTVSRPVAERATHDRSQEADRPDTGPETGRETVLGPGGRGPRHSSPSCRGDRHGGSAVTGPADPARNSPLPCGEPLG